MIRWLVLDFETRSVVDLKRAGAYRYAEDPTTEVLTVWFESYKGRRLSWHPGEPILEAIRLAIRDGWMFVCHNAGFERNIWTQCMEPAGWPPIPLAQWHDTMARACQTALPAGLEPLLRVLQIGGKEKDKEGSRLTVGLSRFNKDGSWPVVTPAILNRVDVYCESDIDGQVGVHKRLGWLPDHERPIWELSQVMNDRGVRVDREFVRRAQRVIDQASGPLAAEFAALTGGLKFTQTGKLKAWANEQGCALENTQAETIDKLLGKDEETQVDDVEGTAEWEIEDAPAPVPPNVRRALTIRRLIGSASVKKLPAMEACVGLDGRARGLLRYHGTTPGRQTGQLLQPQNFPRGSDEMLQFSPEHKVAAIKTGDADWVETVTGVGAVEAVVGSLRHALVPDPDRVFLSGDYSGIQARTVLALAGQADKAALMGAGVDVYIDMACDIFPELPRPDWQAGKDIFKPQAEAFKKAHTDARQYGKNSVLGLGFQMGALKFLNKYCEGQGLEFAKRIVDAYRKSWAPRVPDLWYGLQDAATKAVWDRRAQEAYGVTYFLRDQWLIARIHNGSELWYFNPRAVTREMPWSTEENPDFRKGWTYQVQKMGQWVTRDAFGGQLTENVVMKIEREIMEGAKKRAEAAGLWPVLDVHDELLCEPRRGMEDEVAYRQLLEDVEPWVRDLGIPIAVDTWSGDYYRK